MTGDRVISDPVAALLRENTLLYPEAEGVRQRITITEDEAVLERFSQDGTSSVSLKKETRGKALISSAFGVMELETELNDLAVSDEEWMVEYKVFSGDETVTYQRIYWHLMNVWDHRE